MREERRFRQLGTICHIAIEAPEAGSLLDQTGDLLKSYEMVFSAHLPASELNQLNQSAGKSPFTASAELFELVSYGKKHSLALHSQLNIALGPLIQAWQIGFVGATKPSQATIDQLLDLCQPKDILLNSRQQSVFLARSGMALDLGALAKGYIADRLLEHLLSAGATSVLIDLGGNVITHGQPFSTTSKWQVGVQLPFAPRGQAMGRVTMGNQALVTSGIYERFFEANGRAYHHILDRQTGYPMETEMVSLTILSDSALRAETYSSQFFGLPIPQALHLIKQTDSIEGLILTSDYRCFLSDGMKVHFIPQYH
ncbi:FAD:protein FMN transferase [Streptococcus entericus]|uniref:FAD:protein FMN transferase n=1 Tax=Streptococcus entericus TaxID=155680 RepID=UPI000362BA4A|nr:FAD:protein FMN transferase [Streptococcus entericus]